MNDIVSADTPKPARITCPGCRVGFVVHRPPADDAEQALARALRAHQESTGHFGGMNTDLLAAGILAAIKEAPDHA